MQNPKCVPTMDLKFKDTGLITTSLGMSGNFHFKACTSKFLPLRQTLQLALQVSALGFLNQGDFT